MKTKIALTSLLIVLAITLYNCKKKKSDPIKGCTDPNSLNYNPDATENDGSCSYAPTYSIGQSYGGGVVFYTTSNGQHGLIAPPNDQSTGCEWGCLGTNLAGASGSVIGTGQQNTNDIISGCSTSTTAAQVCDQLTLSGYSDWYLPSQDELQKLYLQRNVIGGFQIADYWSSTEMDNNNARSITFDNFGSYVSMPKNNNCKVRAIRSF